MSSLTGLAASSITSMIPGLCAAGQMKLVGASSGGGSSQSAGHMTAPSSIFIPALTGSQIAIVYLETKATVLNSQYPFMFTANATGSGLYLEVTCNGFPGDTQQTTNSGFRTTTGNQTISFSVTSIQNSSLPSSRMDIKTAVFIYTPPF